jgi:hypothetical protein
VLDGSDRRADAEAGAVHRPIVRCSFGAPEEIRTPDPQIRSLVLYPAELRALAPGNDKTPRCQPYPRRNARGVASNLSLWMASLVMCGQVFRASIADWVATGGHRGRASARAEAVVGECMAKGPGWGRHIGFHARRAPRRSLSSTARSGMMSRKVAPIVPSTSRISPPCARTSSAAMASPRPVPPARVEP